MTPAGYVKRKTMLFSPQIYPQSSIVPSHYFPETIFRFCFFSLTFYFDTVSIFAGTDFQSDFSHCFSVENQRLLVGYECLIYI